MMTHRSGKPFTDRRDHYQEVTDKIIAALESGTKPWQQPWKNGSPGMPVNAATGRRYHGINVLLLTMTAFALGGDPRFCSYKQAADRGWQVRRGERGTTVFFFKRMLVRDKDAPPDCPLEECKAVPVLRAYTVFNGAQIDGIPAYVAPNAQEASWRRPEAADIIIANSQVTVRYGGDKAFYSPTMDFCQLPEPGSFHSPEAFAATALHELAHASGAKHRLDRDLRGRFGSAAYAQEELRAELASVFIGATLDLPCDIPHHASYIGEWAAKLKENKREIFRAAAEAQRIADYLLALHPDYATAHADAAQDHDDEATATEASPVAEVA